MCRTNEEVNLLYAEARACRRGLQFAGALRDKTSQAPPEYASPGATAYAHQKADMFRSMATRSWEAVVAAREAHCADISKSLDGLKIRDELERAAQLEKHALRQEAFKVTQESLLPAMETIDYAVVGKGLHTVT